MKLEQKILMLIKSLDNSKQLIFKNINRNISLIETACESNLITSLDANNRIAEQFILIEKCISRYLADLMTAKYMSKPLKMSLENIGS